MSTTSLLTDKYEYTMLDDSFMNNTYSTKCVFEVFAKRIAGNRKFGTFCGATRAIEELSNFKFTGSDINYLETFMKSKKAIDFLKHYKFSGNIFGYSDGECYFEYSPVLTIEGTFAECIILETLILSIVNHDSAIATAATRMVHFANKKKCIEMGSRRTHEKSAIDAAYVAYLCGFAGTSNLKAGQKYNIPTFGTVSHAWTLLHNSETEAFEHQIRSHGKNTTLLVDTYNIETGIKNAISISGKNLSSIRIDSGDLQFESKNARQLLNKLGAKNTKIIVTSDIGEEKLRTLKNSPIDSYGIGSKLVTGDGVPTAEFVYKLVKKNNTPVAKKSANKKYFSDRKYAYRVIGKNNIAISEILLPTNLNHYKKTTHNKKIAKNFDKNYLRPLQHKYVSGGVIYKKFIGKQRIKKIKKIHKIAISELPKSAWNLSSIPAIKTIIKTLA